MSEINRVFAHIDGFFEAAGTGQCMALANAIGRCAVQARQGYHDRDMEDEVLLERIETIIVKAKQLGNSPPETVEERKKTFRDLAVEAMTARRAILPLNHPTRRHRTIEPKDALFNDDDQFAFAIYDTLADEISECLPDLQKLAVEVFWDADQLE